MKRIAVLAVLLALVGVPAFAGGIINGGFETGLSGWTTSGQVTTSFLGSDPRTNNVLGLPIYGTASARVGDDTAFNYGGSSQSSLSQTWLADSTDLYFKWAAVGLVPDNDVPHTTAQTPWFQVLVRDVTTNTVLFQEQYYTGNLGSITSGWYAGAVHTQGNGDDAGIWYYRPWETFHLLVTAGDSISIALTTRDCTLGGHATYAYLDGFGTQAPPDVVPEPASILLVGTGILVAARKLRK